MSSVSQSLLVLLLLTAMLWVPGRWLRIFPQGRLFVLAALPCGASLVLVVLPQAWPVLLGLDGVLLLVALADLLSLPRANRFELARQAGRVVSLRHGHRIELILQHRSSRPLSITLRDGLPAEFQADPPQFQLRVAPHCRLTLPYRLQSQRRGAFRLRQIHLRVTSRAGLWQRLLDYPVETELHVYPDLKQLRSYAVLARLDRLNLIGVRRARRIGQDNEFERLRDYTPDDNFRHVEWRSTARRGKLTVKDFQQNQSQRLVFLVDCGRMMANQAQGLSLLDHAFNAMLMLSYVALSRGDAVGLVCFSDEVHHFVPPRAGLRQMNRLLHAVFDRFPRLVESRYDLAFSYLAARSPKRSLVVLITNLIDEVNAQQVERHLKHLVGRHLPLGVLLRDREVYDALLTGSASEAPDDSSLYRAAAAADLLSWRQQVLSALAREGALVVDAFPEDLTAPLVNRYLEVKARHLL